LIVEVTDPKGLLKSKFLNPPSHDPKRMRIEDGEVKSLILVNIRVGNMILLSNKGAEKGVYKTRPFLSPVSLCQFNSFMDRSRGRDFRKKLKLIKAESKDIQDFSVNPLKRDIRKMSDHPVEPLSPS
jgi:hypothetical protein